MSYTVNWTDESENTFNENIEYLSKSWDLQSINNFLDRVDEVVENIQSNPKLYPVYRKSGKVYKCVVNRHITVYYKIVDASNIDLITFWNTHKNPDDLKV